MDFDAAENWGVEQTASDLDRSLFGTLNGTTGNKQKTKKRKLKTEQVVDCSSPVKKTKNDSSVNKIIQSDYLSGYTDDKNLSKKRKKRLKDKQRKLMKKKQKLQSCDSEGNNKTSDSSKKNKNTDENLNVKVIERRDTESVRKKNIKKKQKLKSDHDLGNKEKQNCGEKTKKKVITGDKPENKGSLEQTDKVNNRKNNKSLNKNQKDKNKQGFSGNSNKQKVDFKTCGENSSTDKSEVQISENVKLKKKKKKKHSKNKSSTDTSKSNLETWLHQDSSNISKQLSKGKTSVCKQLNFSQIKTPDTKIGKKRFNINELKSVLLKDSMSTSVPESVHTKDENFKSDKFKKSRNNYDHRNQVKGNIGESPGKDKHENKMKGKKDESQVEQKVENPRQGKKVVTSLKERMTEQLKSARFRYLNEQLYTQTSQSAYKMFQEDKEAFQVYHDGFQGQVSKWPVNPVDIIISYIKNKPKQLVVADFGCGDAKISQNVPNKVHSFDLVAVNEHVTVCDMSKVPLKDNSIDIAVFCLSLMGTNLNDYLSEACRVLKKGGTLKIAEVTSRFQSTSIARFIIGVEQYGFQFIQKDTTNKMFVMMDFKKTKSSKVSLTELQLDPCLYKKR